MKKDAEKETPPAGGRSGRRRHGMRRADIILAVLALAVIAVVAADMITRNRKPAPAAPARPSAMVQNETSGNPAQLGDLETASSEFDENDSALPDSRLYSDPSGARVSSSVDDPALAAALDPEIEKVLKVGRVPSLTIALISGDKIVWTRAAGLADIRTKTPASCDTVYVVGSTFKTITTAALLQQFDQGKFKLDDSVNDYLTEFKIQGENKRWPVTFRRLLTHTSGLPTDFGRYAVWADQGPGPLAQYLNRVLRLEHRPGTRVVYSNIAYTLAAYLVEKFSGTPFKEYVQRNIFDPLEMKDMAFEPRPDMAERLAIPYIPVRRRGVYRPVDWAKADVWPAGVVYATVIDQAHWLTAILNRGVYKGHRILSEVVFREMMTKQYERFSGPLNGGWLNDTTGYGLTWWISKEKGETIIAHSGSIDGYTAFLAGNLDRRIGVAILTNGHKAHRHIYPLALKALEALRNRP